MISDQSQSKNAFLSRCAYLGIAINSFNNEIESQKFVDLEKFFVEATNELDTSRIFEGYLCWLIEYGHILSPSKIRNLIKCGSRYNPSVLGGVLDFIISNKIGDRKWKILSDFIRKAKVKKEVSPLQPRVRNPQPNFLKYNIYLPNFELNKEKYLRRKEWVLKNCVVINNRSLFGSVIHSDLASYLHYYPQATPSQIAKATGNHKARIFKFFTDVKNCIMSQQTMPAA